MSVKINVAGESVTVESPYSKEFVAGARNLNGRWNGSAWSFDANQEARVRALCMEVYGTDGVTAKPTTLVRVRISDYKPTGRFVLNPYVKDNAATFGPMSIAVRFGRDGRVRLADGVVIIEGGFPDSAGSNKYPALFKFNRTEDYAIAEFEAPVDLAKREAAANPELVELVEVEPAR